MFSSNAPNLGESKAELHNLQRIFEETHFDAIQADAAGLFNETIDFDPVLNALAAFSDGNKKLL